MGSGAGTKDDPWVLTTAPGSSQYTMFRDSEADPPALVCRVGTTTLHYHLRAIEDLHIWFAARATGCRWERPMRRRTRHQARSRRGAGPPLLEAMGLAELTHDARNNSVRAVDPGAC